MKCLCGGILNRIAFDCYQCEVCKVKQKAAFIVPNIGVKGEVCISGNGTSINTETSIDINIGQVDEKIGKRLLGDYMKSVYKSMGPSGKS